MPKTTNGFTLVELLIVIVVIAILAAITIVAYNGVQDRAHDSVRAQDLATIEKSLKLYNIENGGTPKPGHYSSTTYSGWDASVNPDWLAFLRADYGKVPVDPVNTITSSNNPPGGGNFTYFYACYTAGSGPLPATDNVRIGYHKSDGQLITDNFPVTACL